MSTKEPETISNDLVTLGPGARRLALGGVVVGIAAIAGAAAITTWHHFLMTYLASLAFLLSIGVGALFFVLVQHLTRSGWSVVVRRLAESAAAGLLPLAAMCLLVIAGIRSIYPWSHESAKVLGAKALWFHETFFVARIAVYFVVLVGIALWFWRTSKKQDESGDPKITLLLRRRAPLSMVFYAFCVAFLSIDLFMSLDPSWFSTIFSAYFWGGGVMAGFAFVIVLAYILDRQGKLGRAVTPEHYHDLGKQMFGWMVFWAYIAFSQYMLMWYGNMPEETQWYHTRILHGWQGFAWALLFAKFAIPFLILLPRGIKRNSRILFVMAIWLLVMQWVDMYWVVVPEPGKGVPFSGADVLCAVGEILVFAGSVTFFLKRGALVPTKDPLLAESLAFENM